MIRKAFRMKLNKGQRDEYKNRHSPIWPELEQVLRNQGVSNYSIFFDESDHSLFGYAEIESEEKWEAIAETSICKKWWAFMEPLMETNSDASPLSIELESVFFMP